MAVLKEYRCAAHGPYEAYSPVCPHGCSGRFQTREIRTAPAAATGTVARTDRTLRGLAESHGMTDIRNDPKSATSVMDEMRKRPDFAPSWGQVPHSAPGFSERGDAAKVDPSAFGVQGDTQLRGGQFGKGLPTALRRDPRGVSDIT